MTGRVTGKRVFSILMILALLLGGLPTGSQTAQAVSPNIVISQVYGGGGNTDATLTHDFIELFNRGASSVSLNGWSLQYASATGTGNFGSSSAQLTELPNVSLAPGQYFLVQEAQGADGTTPLPTPDLIDPTPIPMSGSGGKVALVSAATSLGCNGGSTPCSSAQLALIVDLVGWGLGTNFSETSPAPMTGNTTAVLRLNFGCTETDNNAADFAAGPPNPRNTASPFNVCGGPPVNQPVVATCGSALAVVQGFAATRSVSATDSDGTVISILINGVTPSPAPGSITLGSLVPAAAVGGTATAVVSVDALVPVGSYAVQVVATNNDATPITGTCSLTVNVQASILPIGTVQGSVADTDNGTAHRSTYAPASGNGSGQTVVVQGVIYEKTLARTSSGGSSNGFFLQNTAATADADPNSSDGIFVFMGSFTSMIGGYIPQVGDEVVVQGRVSEFFNFTQLGSASALAVVRSGVDLEAEIAGFDVNPPDLLADANRYWERHEGMRGTIPAMSKTIDGRDVFPGTADGEIWLIRGDHEIALWADPYDRRAFRDPHPVDNDPALFDDSNGYRIIIGSYGVKAAAGDNTVLLPPARTFDTITNALTGGVYYTFSKYAIMVTEQPVLENGVDPAANNPPQAFGRTAEYSLAPYNVENLYDYRDDPFDGCDFAGNPGCTGVRPPFDYVPADLAAYQAHLNDIAQQIVADLHSPDILFIQEAEDQDICTVEAGALVCGVVDNADGKPDTLQDLALAVASFGGPAYDAAYDRNGADDRGIVSGFLNRTDRVELLPADTADPVLGSSPTVDYRGTPLSFNTDVQNPKALNADLPDDVDLSTGVDGINVFTRAPQVGLFRIWKDGTKSGASIDLYAISNHFSSTPNARVGQRTEQSLYDAAIVAALQAVDPDVNVAVGGDFNVYPRPDDPFVPGHPLFPSDQLGPLYDAGLLNLYDQLLTVDDDSAYSYVFQGQTQTLDQLFVTQSLFVDMTQARVAHVNADFAADYFGDVARGASDHDPVVARFCRAQTTVTVNPAILWPPKHKYMDVSVSLSSDADPAPSAVLVSAASNEPDNGLDDGNTANDIVIVDDLHLKLRAERDGLGTGRIYTLTYNVTDSCGLVSTISVYVIVPVNMSDVKNMLAMRETALPGNLSIVYIDGISEVYLPLVLK